MRICTLEVLRIETLGTLDASRVCRVEFKRSNDVRRVELLGRSWLTRANPGLCGSVGNYIYWLKVPGSCVSVLFTGHIKEPGCLFEVRARRIMPGMPVSNCSLSLLASFSQSVPLVRSCCICTGRGCTCALVAAIYRGDYIKCLWTCFRKKRALYKSGILFIYFYAILYNI